MPAHAYALNRRLGDLAGDVMARRVQFRPDPDMPEDLPA
jgi:hypothetical protein